MSNDKQPKDSAGGDQEAPKIEFPCSYPIKVIGNAVEDFQELVLAVFEKHAGKIAADSIRIQKSSKSNYLSITVTIIATGKEQLQRIFDDLKTLDCVKMVL